MAEGARLESVYTATYREFESPPHRHIQRRARTKVRAFFFAYCTPGGMRSPDRGSTTGAASWTDHEHSEWAARRASEASQSPPSPPYSKKSSYESASFFFAYCTPGGMRSPDRGSTTGAASWTDHEHSEWAARRASEASQSPPHRHIQRRARTKVRFFFRILSVCTAVNGIKIEFFFRLAF